ncbi:MAG: hypothetical protein F2840_06975 [Actinobacteria bacterium]|jgi:hypothetical protein|uniref:Unannotated protein n=1 Tax=freshwater metagenome TaxID=449393 RepID=A0A6J7JYY8_9ZZZZ|nr:hypothetical protein [Actinomycetota bacterium]
MQSPSAWLRVNAQHYLLRDSQARVARRRGYAPPNTAGSFFWTKVFIPIYRVMPWGLRRRIMVAIPGSHTKQWAKQGLPEGPAV